MNRVAGHPRRWTLGLGFALLVVGATWAFATPPMAGPDEAAHRRRDRGGRLVVGEPAPLRRRGRLALVVPAERGLVASPPDAVAPRR